MNNNFERRKTIDYKSDDLEKIIKEYIKILEDNRIDSNDFISDINGYTKEDIRKDNNLVKYKQKTWQKNKEAGVSNFILDKGLEAVIYYNIKENNWFKNSKVYPTSLYDDIEKGIDLIAYEKNNDEEEINGVGVSFDVTIAKKEYLIAKKIYYNLRNIIQNNFTQPKYLLIGKKENKQPKLPVCVFSCSTENAKKLIRATKNKDEKTIKDFNALFNFQLKIFIEKAIKLLESIDYTNKDKKINKMQALINLHNTMIYLEKSTEEIEIPVYLKEDINFSTFISVLDDEAENIKDDEIIADNIQSVQTNKETGAQNNKRPRIRKFN